MNRNFLAAICAVGMFAQPISAQTIKGSDTVLPLVQKEAEAFLKTNKSAKVTITGGGSGVGISSLLDGTTEIAMASRKIKFDERSRFQQSGRTVVEKVIAYDALAVSESVYQLCTFHSRTKNSERRRIYSCELVRVEIVKYQVYKAAQKNGQPFFTCLNYDFFSLSPRPLQKRGGCFLCSVIAGLTRNPLTITHLTKGLRI